MCVLISLQLLSATFLILRRNQRDIVNVHTRRSSCKVLVILVRFILNLNSLDIYKIHCTIKFHECPSHGSQVVPCRRTDGQT
jgi:hypothetical protein